MTSFDIVGSIAIFSKEFKGIGDKAKELLKIKNIEKITEIVYDTSSINYIAMAVISLVNRCKNNYTFNPRHKSFHSYAGVKNIIIDDPDKSLFLIFIPQNPILCPILPSH